MKKPRSTKKYQKLYNETARIRILGVLFRFPDKEFSLSDLAKEAKVAKANIGKILDEFYDMGLVEISKLKVIWRIKANRFNPAFVSLKIPDNLLRIYESGLADFLKSRIGSAKAIILFGSFRKGDDTSESDIDMAVEASSMPSGLNKNYNAVELKSLGRNKDENDLIGQIEYFLGKKVQVHIFTRKGIDLNVFNNIANGIIIDGFLEVKP